MQVQSLTALIVARLTLKVKVLAAALTDLPPSRKSFTACVFSESSAGGLPPVLPSAAARSTPAYDPDPDGVPLPLGQGQEHVRHWLGGWNETRLS